MTECPFCNLAPDQVWADGPTARALFDRYPVSDGHTLVVPTRHTGSIFDLPAHERASLWQLVAEVRSQLEHTHHVDAFTIGVNDGQLAGQTVAHAHIHAIPCREGDVPDPRGGVRWVIPSRARYRPRTPEGKPELSPFWRALAGNTARRCSACDNRALSGPACSPTSM